MLPELNAAELDFDICESKSTKIGETINCKTFNVEFSGKNHLKRHMKLHNAEQSFKCDICNEKFRENPDLERHLERHTEGKSLKCHICPKTLSKKSNLLRHLKLHTHKPELFECYTCGMKIKAKRDLIRHFMVHTGEKPFKCSICNKRFGSQNTLNKHTRTHTGEKPFKCNICDKKISRRYLLNHHLKLHTGEKTTKDGGSDVSRMMSLGEKLFECYVCSKAFPSKTKIKNHVLRHTNNRKYECNICSQTFYTKAELNRHSTRIQNACKSPSDNVKGLVIREVKVYLGEKICSGEHIAALARKNSLSRDIQSEKIIDDSSPLKVLHGEKSLSTDHRKVCGKNVTSKSDCTNYTTLEDSTQSKIRNLNIEERRLATYMKQQLGENKQAEAVEKSFIRKEPNETTVHSSQHLKVRSSQTLKSVDHSTHSTDNPKVCVVCSRRFNRQTSLSNHIKVHSRENSSHKIITNRPCKKTNSADAYVNVNPRKSLRSDTCVKKFKEYCLSNYPSSVHTSQKPFESDIHDIDIEKPPKVRTSVTSFDCFTCHGKFDEEINLIRHLRLHTSEKPSYIGKEGASTRQLNNDSGDKPFKCYTCHKTFDQQVRLTQHLRMHVSGEEISCGICNIQLKHKNDLPAHLLVHTTEISNCGNDPLTLAGGYSVTDIVTIDFKIEVEENDVYYSEV